MHVGDIMSTVCYFDIFTRRRCWGGGGGGNQIDRGTGMCDVPFWLSICYPKI